jgi:16S rRNA (guanine527-N7)-methyltransferase
VAFGADQLRELIRGGLAELGSPGPTRELVERLASLAELVARWTRRVDLTGHRTAEEVARRLVLDALALAAAAPAFRALADLGSGAGFPGLPIAIRYPERTVTLVESRERRHHFQLAAIRELEIRNARPVHGRAEELPSEPHDLVVAQAVGDPGTALPWMLRWSRPGGALLVPGAAAAPASAEIESWTPLEYSVPQGGGRRSWWLGRIRAARGGEWPPGCGNHGETPR